MVSLSASMHEKDGPAWTHAAYHEACHGRPMAAVHLHAHCRNFFSRHSQLDFHVLCT